MKETDSFVKSLVEPMLISAHFHMSLLIGWWVFHNWVYSLTYFAKVTGVEVPGQIPAYTLNVMAFGCLVYITTRPLALLAGAILQGIERTVIKLDSAMWT